MVESKRTVYTNGPALPKRIERAMRRADLTDLQINAVVTQTKTKADDLITLHEAEERFSVPYGTLKGWVTRGLLERKGREKFHAPGGGRILVDPADVEDLIASPPRSGRPKNGD